MDACSGFEALCRGEEDGLLRVKKVRFVGDIISQLISACDMKEYESASFYGCYMTLCPWLRFGRKLNGYMVGREESGAESVRTVYFAT